MYESFYRLKTKPFSLFPDEGVFYPDSKRKTAFSMIQDGLLNPAGFIVITGGPGTGKTALLQRVVKKFQDRFAIGLISHTHGTLGVLMPWILMAFNQPKGGDPVESYQRFAEFLAAEKARGRRVLLIVDEAQNLAPGMLEELRVLSNDNGTAQGIQIVLAGQPGLLEVLGRPELAQFAQRVAVNCTLDPLSEGDTVGYIRHRIRAAGGKYPVFTEQACRLVYRLAGGVPRLVNQVADAALAYGCTQQQTWVTTRLLGEVVRDHSKRGMLPATGPSDLLCSGQQPDMEEKKEIETFESGAARRPPEPTEAPYLPGAPPIDAAERYERGLALKRAGQYKSAIDQFQQAAEEKAIAVKAYAQMGLCYKSAGHQEEAVTAFRKALTASAGSGKETVQILYVLGRTLESLGRIAETLEAYRWIRREDPEYRDVASRIERLSSHRAAGGKSPSGEAPAAGAALKSWQQLLRNLSSSI